MFEEAYETVLSGENLLGKGKRRDATELEIQ